MNGTPSITGTGVREVLDAVRHLVRALRLGNQEAERRLGLSSAQLFVLHSLDGGGGLSLKEVAARTATDQSSVSVVVARLVELGLVRRRRSPADRRRLELTRTARAEALLRKAPARLVQHGLVDAIEALPPGQRRTLGRLLARVVSAMGGADRAPGMFFESPPSSRGPGRGRTRNGS